MLGPSDSPCPANFVSVAQFSTMAQSLETLQARMEELLSNRGRSLSCQPLIMTDSAVSVDKFGEINRKIERERLVPVPIVARYIAADNVVSHWAADISAEEFRVIDDSLKGSPDAHLYSGAFGHSVMDYLYKHDYIYLLQRIINYNKINDYT